MPPRFFRNQRVIYFLNEYDPHDGGEIGWHGVVADVVKRTELTYVIHVLNSDKIVYARAEDLYALPGERLLGRRPGDSFMDCNDHRFQRPVGLLLLQRDVADDNKTISGACHLPGNRWATFQFEKSTHREFAFQFCAATDAPDDAARIRVSTPANVVLNRDFVLATLSHFLSTDIWREIQISDRI